MSCSKKLEALGPTPSVLEPSVQNSPGQQTAETATGNSLDPNILASRPVNLAAISNLDAHKPDEDTVDRESLIAST